MRHSHCVLAAVCQDRLQHLHSRRVLPLAHAERDVVAEERGRVAQRCGRGQGVGGGGGRRRVARTACCSGRCAAAPRAAAAGGGASPLDSPRDSASCASRPWMLRSEKRTRYFSGRLVSGDRSFASSASTASGATSTSFAKFAIVWTQSAAARGQVGAQKAIYKCGNGGDGAPLCPSRRPPGRPCDDLNRCSQTPPCRRCCWP